MMNGRASSTRRKVKLLTPTLPLPALKRRTRQRRSCLLMPFFLVIACQLLCWLKINSFSAAIYAHNQHSGFEEGSSREWDSRSSRNSSKAKCQMSRSFSNEMSHVLETIKQERSANKGRFSCRQGNRSNKEGCVTPKQKKCTAVNKPSAALIGKAVQFIWRGHLHSGVVKNSVGAWLHVSLDASPNEVVEGTHQAGTCGRDQARIRSTELSARRDAAVARWSIEQHCILKAFFLCVCRLSCFLCVTRH